MVQAVAQEADKWRLGEASAYLLKKVGFEPTGPEQAAILRSRVKRKLVVGGEQGGKSITSSADWVLHLYEDKVRFPGEPLLYWLVAMDYHRTSAEFGYLADNIMKLDLPLGKDGVSKRVDPGSIEVRYPGAAKYDIRIETKSGKDPRTLSMFAPHGIIMCEASQCDLETYFKCLARVAPKDGWLHLAGTYESSLGWYPGLAAAWAHGSAREQSFRLPSPTNFYAYPQGLETESLKELRRQTSDQFFNERIMGVAAPPKGMVFAEFRPDVHIRPVGYDPDLPVYISNDPGYGHANAVLFWQVAQGGQIHVFDEVYERGIIMEDVINICMKREGWKAESKTLTADPNYSQQHHGSRSMAEIWQNMTGLTPFGTKIKVAEGTERLKSFLKVDALSGAPGIVFNPKCRGILSELGANPNPFDGQTRVYSWKLDSEGNVVGDAPDDKNNDGCKALIYGIVEKFGLASSAGNEHFTVTNLEMERKRQAGRTYRSRRALRSHRRW
jgi:hypothetical protein